jgi:predicted flap endonuclease-1-like 5' DNA nuclease
MKLVLAALAVLALAACGGGDSSSPAAEASAPADDVTDIDGIGPIREQFNRDAGSPRLLLLFSPT